MKKNRKGKDVPPSPTYTQTAVAALQNVSDATSKLALDTHAAAGTAARSATSMTYNLMVNASKVGADLVDSTSESVLRVLSTNTSDVKQAKGGKKKKEKQKQTKVNKNRKPAVPLSK